MVFVGFIGMDKVMLVGVKVLMFKECIIVCFGELFDLFLYGFVMSGCVCCFVIDEIMVVIYVLLG